MTLTRRGVIRAGTWTAPVIMTVGAAPAMAVSSDQLIDLAVSVSASSQIYMTGSPVDTFFDLKNVGTNPTVAGEKIVFTVRTIGDPADFTLTLPEGWILKDSTTEPGGERRWTLETSEAILPGERTLFRFTMVNTGNTIYQTLFIGALGDEEGAFKGGDGNPANNTASVVLLPIFD